MSRTTLEELVYKEVSYLSISDEHIDELVESIVSRLYLEGGGSDHIVYVDVDGVFTLQHPVDERFEHEGLFECQYTALVRTAAEQRAFSPNTKNRVWLDRSVLMWEEVAP